MKRRTWQIAVLALLVLRGGCVQPRRDHGKLLPEQIRWKAMECLKRAIRYTPNPAVRAEAVEALERCGGREAEPWIRAALLDKNPGVRFAACVAAGRHADMTAESGLRDRIDDDDPSVRVAALFALHRLGFTDRTGFMPGYLLDHAEPTVRRNAALVLGLMGEPGVIKILARAMRDPDAGVRHYALEAMARLGNPEARQELVFMTSAGIGADEVFAITGLMQTGDRAYVDTFRYKLATAPHIETRLAAARGLGVFGIDEGFETALRALDGRAALTDDPKDPVENQTLRVRQLAAAALGAIGRQDALPALARLMNDPSDPRVQVSAAQAILMIINANETRELPFEQAIATQKE
ncbi:MAG: HEAT repeat domain-containing protein [Phycisphaerae bacterium]